MFTIVFFGLVNSAEPYAQTQEHFKLLIINTLAAYLIHLARGLQPDQTFAYTPEASIGPRSRPELLNEATQLISLATSISQSDPMALVNRGLNLK